MKDPLIIYGPDFSSYVRSAVLCCLEKGIDYEIKPIAELKQGINPFKKVPVIEDGGVVVYETAAICRYIDRAYSGAALSPSDPIQLAWMDQWISAANCYFDSAIVRRYVLEYVFPKGENGVRRGNVIAAAKQDIKGYLTIMDDALNKYPYFSGETAGIADFLIIPMLDYLANGVVPTNLVAEYQSVNEYYEMMLQREACKRALGVPQM